MPRRGRAGDTVRLEEGGVLAEVKGIDERWLRLMLTDGTRKALTIAEGREVTGLSAWYLQPKEPHGNA